MNVSDIEFPSDLDQSFISGALNSTTSNPLLKPNPASQQLYSSSLSSEPSAFTFIECGNQHLASSTGSNRGDYEKVCTITESPTAAGSEMVTVAEVPDQDKELLMMRSM